MRSSVIEDYVDVQQGQSQKFVIDNEGTLRLGTRLCVPDVDELKKEIMKETPFFYL